MPVGWHGAAGLVWQNAAGRGCHGIDIKVTRSVIRMTTIQHDTSFCVEQQNNHKTILQNDLQNFLLILAWILLSVYLVNRRTVDRPLSNTAPFLTLVEQGDLI